MATGGGQIPRPQLPQELLLDIAKGLANILVHFHTVFDETAGVKHRPVVPAAKSLANDAKRALRHLAREKHSYLSREGDVLGPAFAGHVGKPDIEMFSHFLLNEFDADRAAVFLMKNFAQQILDQLDV